MFVLGVIGSPGYPQDEQVLRSHLERAARRGLYPDGSARQIAAILASGDRRPLLQRIAAPTLVIHGASDPLVRPAAGHDTAQNIPGARLEMIDGMGHDFPPALMAKIALMIAQHCKAHGAAVDAAELPVDVEVAAAGTPAAIPAAREAGQLCA
jgi:proline iminopeptidase